MQPLREKGGGARVVIVTAFVDPIDSHQIHSYVFEDNNRVDGY